MDRVEDTYKGGFFKGRHRLGWRAPIVCTALIKAFDLTKQDTIIDVGCAIGEYVEWFNSMGFASWGIEGSSAAREFFLTEMISIWDIRKPLAFNLSRAVGQYSLAMSFEVAEHIAPEYTFAYLDNLCNLSPTILMTAAPPGQKGHGHVNCQEKGWWTCEMENRNYKRDFKAESTFINALQNASSRREVLVYSNNVMIFRDLKCFPLEDF